MIEVAVIFHQIRVSVNEIENGKKERKKYSISGRAAEFLNTELLKRLAVISD